MLFTWLIWTLPDEGELLGRQDAMDTSFNFGILRAGSNSSTDGPSTDILSSVSTVSRRRLRRQSPRILFMKENMRSTWAQELYEQDEECSRIMIDSDWSKTSSTRGETSLPYDVKRCPIWGPATPSVEPSCYNPAHQEYVKRGHWEQYSVTSSTPYNTRFSLDVGKSQAGSCYQRRTQTVGLCTAGLHSTMNSHPSEILFS